MFPLNSEPIPVLSSVYQIELFPDRYSRRRSLGPRGLRRVSAVSRLLGWWVRIPPEAWIFLFEIRGSVHRKRVFKYNQQEAMLTNLLISVTCSKCFRRFLRPSSGAQTVYTASGTLSNLYFYLPLSWKRWKSISSTRMAGSSKGLTKYPMLYIQSELLMMGGGPV